MGISLQCKGIPFCVPQRHQPRRDRNAMPFQVFWCRRSSVYQEPWVRPDFYNLKLKITGSSLGASLNNVEALENQMLIDLEDDIVFHSVALELAELKKEKILLKRAMRESSEDIEENSAEVDGSGIEVAESVDVNQEHLGEMVDQKAETEVNLGSPAVHRGRFEDENAEKQMNVAKRSSDSNNNDDDSNKETASKSLEKKKKSKEPIECPHCERQCASKQCLEIHLFTHTGERPFKCLECDSRFTQPSSLRTHVKVVHRGEKPFDCDVCEMKFSKKYSLITHKRTHDGSKPYACDICEMAFSLKQSLTIHERTHTGIKPHECDICGRTFTQRGAMKRHKITHLGKNEKQRVD